MRASLAADLRRFALPGCLRECARLGPAEFAQPDALRLALASRVADIGGRLNQAGTVVRHVVRSAHDGVPGVWPA